MDRFYGDLEFGVVLVLGIFVFIIFIRKYTEWTRKINLDEYNEKHTKKFKTYEDLQKHLEKEKEKQLLKEEKKPKKEIIEPKRESFAKTIFSGGDSLTGNIARLKKLYKNGTLTKAEFEKAKNNLLK
jgi:hypothetical protein